MDIQLFQTFLTVARLGNMTQAAEQLNFTQPTVTGQIRLLEQHFGVMLFERVGRRLYITEEGRRLVGYSERILAAFEEAQAAFDVNPGIVNLGIVSSVVNYILLPILREYQLQVPQGSVTMETCANTRAVVKGILENRFDLGFVNELSSGRLNQFEILKEQLVWVAHRTLLAAKNASDDVRDYPLLAYKAGGLFHQLYDRTLVADSFASAIEYTDSEVLKKAVFDGLGIGALPSVMVQPSLEDGTLIEFAGMARIDFTIWIVFHKDKILSPAARSFLKLLHANLRCAGGLSSYLNK